MILHEQQIIEQIGIKRETARDLSAIQGPEINELFILANRVRVYFRKNRVDLCSIINAKSGACPEDCSFCAQSARSSTGVTVHPLLSREDILDAAAYAQEKGVRRFCIVTSGRKPSPRELDEICSCISGLRDLGLLPCATLGILDEHELGQLQSAGLNRYHHNLETSEAFFSDICSTHSYHDKVRTIESAKAAGLSVCSGGIFGMGETWEDRIDMAIALRDLDVDSVPINLFTPIKGTPLGDRDVLRPLEALKIISLYRLILPDREIRVCGGRPVTFRDLHPFIFLAGADGLLIGNYLTTSGRDPDDDLFMIRELGLEI